MRRLLRLWRWLLLRGLLAALLGSVSPPRLRRMCWLIGSGLSLVAGGGSGSLCVGQCGRLVGPLAGCHRWGVSPCRVSRGPRLGFAGGLRSLCMGGVAGCVVWCCLLWRGFRLAWRLATLLVCIGRGSGVLILCLMCLRGRVCLVYGARSVLVVGGGGVAVGVLGVGWGRVRWLAAVGLVWAVVGGVLRSGGVAVLRTVRRTATSVVVRSVLLCVGLSRVTDPCLCFPCPVPFLPSGG